MKISVGDRLHFDLHRAYGMRKRHSLECVDDYMLVAPSTIIALQVQHAEAWSECVTIWFLNEMDSRISCGHFFGDEIKIIP